MVSINYAFKEIFSKIVYYGPGLSGKTTNLQYVFSKVPKETRGELISLATDADRTLYFDFLPVNVGQIRGFDVKFQLYTVPGQVYYNATRKLVLRGVDGLVFVADSQLDKMDDNIESLKNLEENLTEYGYNIDDLAFVIQYNKRDLPNIAQIEQLQELLNPKGVPYYEAVATTGQGVFATLKAISKMVMDKAKNSGMGKPKQTRTFVMEQDGTTSENPKPEPQIVKPEITAPTPEPEKTVVPEKPELEKTVIPEKPELEKTVMLEKPEISEPAVSRETVKANTTVNAFSEASPETTVETTAQISQDVSNKPTIMTETNGLNTNVVVSTTAEDTEEDTVEPPKDDLEETTEHSVLKDDVNLTKENGSEKTYHPDVLDAEKLSELYVAKQTEPELSTERSFDEEATSIADPKQQSNLMSKPHMAESKKVKDKKKFELFGWLKKKKK